MLDIAVVVVMVVVKQLDSCFVLVYSNISNVNSGIDWIVKSTTITNVVKLIWAKDYAAQH